MKRAGRLFDRILDPDNLRLAFVKASRGKRHREDQRAFEEDLDAELEKLRRGLADGTYPVGNYLRFRVFDPKEREICAAAFGERVLHHALMNLCEPEFDRRLSPDSFACRRGGGQTAAVARASEWCRRRSWFMKCDIRKYFDSIPHDGMRRVLSRVFKDPMVLFWFDRILQTYETAPGRGLPIGNLTSQHFANLYLDPVDRMAGTLVRYMDDFVYFGATKEELLERRAETESRVATLGLSLKFPPCPRHVSGGIPFLGRRVYGWGSRPDKRARLRFRRKSEAYAARLAVGDWSQETYQRRATALLAALRPPCPYLGNGPQGPRATTASFAAGATGTTRGTAAPRTGTGTTRTTATGTTGSAFWPSSTQRNRRSVPARFPAPERDRKQTPQGATPAGASRLRPNAPAGDLSS